MVTTPTYEAKYNSLLLGTFKSVIRFLNAHNLKWFCGYGTMLGAVRHNGMIPWDDDVDIFMPKDDFDKLATIKEELEIDHFKLLSFYNTGYYCPHCKIIDTNTTLWENEYYPFVTGIFIDIFPLYRTDITGDELVKKVQEYRSVTKSVIRTVKKMPFNEFLKALSKNDRVWREFFINKIKYPRFMNRYYLKKLMQIEKQIYKEDGEYVVSLASECGEKQIIKASIFADYLEVPFEDFKVRIPIGYHDFLTKVYGDYMTPPPEKDRALTHVIWRHYINLKEGLSLKEVRKRLKRGEREVY